MSKYFLVNLSGKDRKIGIPCPRLTAKQLVFSHRAVLKMDFFFSRVSPVVSIENSVASEYDGLTCIFWCKGKKDIVILLSEDPRFCFCQHIWTFVFLILFTVQPNFSRLPSASLGVN